ncbi:MAG: hypothetical protein JXQ71_14540 [Verrucomicrobia bacterium]|nr:hypothetical protein [Verrucomicrobiota bacterium]
MMEASQDGDAAGVLDGVAEVWPERRLPCAGSAPRWPTAADVAIGMAAGIVILRLIGSPPDGARRPSGPILSECDGHLRELVVHYEPSARDMVTPVYRDFVGALDADLTVHVVCPSDAAFAELARISHQVPGEKCRLAAIAGRSRCALRPVVVGPPLTTWAHDRWVVLTPPALGGPTTLLSPRGEVAEEIWPARAGDERVGQDLAAALAPSVGARRSRLYFDGGDFLADSEAVFVVSRMLLRNVQQTVRSREELVRVLSSSPERRVRLPRRGIDTANERRSRRREVWARRSLALPSACRSAAHG